MDEDATAGTTGTYDRIAELYDARWAAAGSPRGDWSAIREHFASAVPPRGRVADLGCGSGRDAAWLRGLGLDVVGVDRSAGMLRLAAAAGVPAVRGDLRRPPIADGVLDGLWSAAALLHVPDEDTEELLARWVRLLKPGGLLFLSTALGEGARWETVPYALGGSERRWFVYRGERRMVDALEAAGFAVQEKVQQDAGRRWLTVIARSRA